MAAGIKIGTLCPFRIEGRKQGAVWTEGKYHANIS